MIKVLLDTDIGGDIDDAICLAYLLKEPQCKLLGITTVCGESEKRRQSQMQSVGRQENGFQLWRDLTEQCSRFPCIRRPGFFISENKRKSI